MLHYLPHYLGNLNNTGQCPVDTQSWALSASISLTLLLYPALLLLLLLQLLLLLLHSSGRSAAGASEKASQVSAPHGFIPPLHHWGFIPVHPWFHTTTDTIQWVSYQCTHGFIPSPHYCWFHTTLPHYCGFHTRAPHGFIPVPRHWGFHRALLVSDHRHNTVGFIPLLCHGFL